MKMQNVKKYIIIAAAVILVMIAVITAIKLPIYLRLKTPFRHIINGFTAADSREMLEALPDALVEKMELSDDDYDDMDDSLSSASEDGLGEFLNDDDYKLKVKLLGHKKLDKKQRETLDDFYSDIGVEIDIKQAYYADFKLSAKSSEDDLSMTYGVTIAKADGKWCIVGGDMLTMPTVVSSVLDYTAKAKLSSANSNAKIAYSVVQSYMSDQEIQGNASAVVFGELEGDIDCAHPEKYSGEKAELAKKINESGLNDGYVRIIKGELDYDYSYYGSYTVQWRKSPDEKLMGQYPDMISSDTFTDRYNGDLREMWGKKIEESDYDY